MLRRSCSLALLILPVLGCQPPILADTSRIVCDEPLYMDADGDGWGGEETSCNDPDAVLQGGDCDDDASSVHPEAAELCNGEDDNCDQVADDGAEATTWYVDADGDGHGDAAQLEELCDTPTTGYSAQGDDCNDTDDTVYPGAPELCDGIDTDCLNDGDGQVATWFGDDGSVTDYTAVPTGSVTLDDDGTLALCGGVWAWRPVIGSSRTVSILGLGETVQLDARAAGTAVTVGSSATVSLSNLEIISARSTGDGGGISVATQADVILTDVNVTGALATGLGGGMSLAAQSTATVTGGSFTEGIGEIGGGIYVEATAELVATGVTFSSNDAVDVAGGIGINGGTATITDCVFTGNTARTAGAIGMNGGELTVLRGYFEANETDDYGGGISVYLADVEITDSDFFENVALTGGGGIFAADSEFVVTGTDFTSNSANTGGAISVSGGLFDLDSASVSTNQVSYDGGGISAVEADLVLNLVTFDTNTASHHGGGLVVNDGSATLTDVVFSENASSVYGGGAALLGAAVVDGFNVTFTENTTYNGAGMLLGEGASVTLAGGSLDGNVATYGGGAYVDGSSLSLDATAVTANEAETGGGIYVLHTVRDGASLAMVDLAMSDNVASLSGGGVYVSGAAAITVSDGTAITGNTAGDNGGGLMLGAFGDLFGGTATCNDASLRSGSPQDVAAGLTPGLGTFTGVNCTVDSLELVGGNSYADLSTFACSSSGCE